MKAKFKHYQKDNISRTNLSGLELKKVLWLKGKKLWRIIANIAIIWGI